jgi:N-methylhydantoinase B
VVSGTDPRNGALFVNQLFLGHTAGAATAWEDAWLTMLHAGNGGMCYIDSVELDEVYTPILVQTRRLIPDSEGAGRFRGAPGIEVEFGPLDCAMEAGFVADGNINAPLGARQGGAAAPSDQFLRRRNGQLERLPQSGQVRLAAGETLVSIACGGGGYGDPRSRDPDRVALDVREGLVSAKRARQVYGVILDDTGAADRPATERHRQQQGESQ